LQLSTWKRYHESRPSGTVDQRLPRAPRSILSYITEAAGLAAALEQLFAFSAPLWH
jgi:hypothetical protein